MKNLNAFGVLLLVAVLMTACSKDDDSPDGGGDIVGSWDLIGLDYMGVNSIESGGQTTEIEFGGEGRDFNTLAVFKSDGTYTTTGSYVIDYVYEIAGMEIKQEVPVQDFAGSGTYTLDGDEITLTQIGSTEVQTHKIEVGSDEMKMLYNQTRVLNNAGVINTITIEGDYTFQRQ